MTEKRTAQNIAATIPCACSHCGMNESVGTRMIEEYAAQELAEYKAKLRHKIKELSLEFVNINAQTVFELIDKL